MADKKDLPYFGMAPSIRPDMRRGPSIQILDPAPFRSLIEASELPFFQQASKEVMPDLKVRVIAQEGQDYQTPHMSKPIKVPEGLVYIEIPEDRDHRDWGPFWNRVDKLRAASKKSK